MDDNRVYIIGGYQTDFARNWSKEGKHISAIMREAFEGALINTDIDVEDINAGIIGNFASELFSHQGMLGAYFPDFDPALNGIPTLRTEAACASGSIALLTAMSFIKANMYDVICVIGVEQMKSVDTCKASNYLGMASWFEKEAKGIDFPFPKLFSKLADEYDKRYGLKSEHLSAIAVKNYSNAKNNPNAQTREWFMNFDHASAISDYNKTMSGMLKVSDCSQITDGAACIFLCSSSFAKKYCDKRKISSDNLPNILGWGHTTAQLTFSNKISLSKENDYIMPETREAIIQAYKRAGIQTCWDLDGIETHDCFTSSEYMAIDHFGLTEPGHSWKVIEDGIIEHNGKLPINPSGGLIGGGHPVGATGVRQALDAFKQVSGVAEGYQIENAKKIATLNIGGTATTNVCLIIGY